VAPPQPHEERGLVPSWLTNSRISILLFRFFGKKKEKKCAVAATVEGSITFFPLSLSPPGISHPPLSRFFSSAPDSASGFFLSLSPKLWARKDRFFLKKPKERRRRRRRRNRRSKPTRNLFPPAQSPAFTRTTQRGPRARWTRQSTRSHPRRPVVGKFEGEKGVRGLFLSNVSPPPHL